MWLDLGDYRGPSRFHAFVMWSVARSRQRAKETAFRVYVTDSLQMAPQGMYLSRRYADALAPKQEIDVDAIIDHVADLLGTEEP